MMHQRLITLVMCAVTVAAAVSPSHDPLKARLAALEASSAARFDALVAQYDNLAAKFEALAEKCEAQSGVGGNRFGDEANADHLLSSRRRLTSSGNDDGGMSTRLNKNSMRTETINVTDIHILGSLLWHGIPVGFDPPTLAPTPAPSELPTADPTLHPTQDPTLHPTPSAQYSMDDTASCDTAIFGSIYSSRSVRRFAVALWGLLECTSAADTKHASLRSCEPAWCTQVAADGVVDVGGHVRGRVGQRRHDV